MLWCHLTAVKSVLDGDCRAVEEEYSLNVKVFMRGGSMNKL